MTTPLRPISEDDPMSWRAQGVQFYPGGAYDALREAATHRGRGPKDFRRSDERLREIICEKLTDDDFIDASQVTVEVQDCDVTLSGTVPIRQQKFAIEDLVASVHGVDEIHNQLNVDDAEIDQRMSGL